MYNKVTLCKAIYERCYKEGKYLDVSGKEIRGWLDNYAIMSDPKIFYEMSRHVLQFCRESDLFKKNEIIAGIELGGMLLAPVLSYQTNLSAVYVRSSQQQYGLKNIIEGGIPLKGKKVIVIGDVLNSGEGVCQSITYLRNEKAIVEHFVCAINLEKEGVLQKLEKMEVKLMAWTTFEKIKYISQNK